MKEKKFRWMPKSPMLRTLMQSPLGILGINWVFQGMLGMQRKELVFRLLLESLLALLVFLSLSGNYAVLPCFILAFFFAHSFNWLFNTHLWVCVRYFPIYRRDPGALVVFLDEIERLLKSLRWLNEAVCIGSVGDSGTIRSERSDIDLRIIFGGGIINWLCVNFLLLYLRTWALIRVVPLDLYAYDNVQALDRFRQDEGLRVLLDRQNRISARYEKRIH